MAAKTLTKSFWAKTKGLVSGSMQQYNVSAQMRLFNMTRTTSLVRDDHAAI